MGEEGLPAGLMFIVGGVIAGGMAFAGLMLVLAALLIK
jgi:hypothetical protein